MPETEKEYFLPVDQNKSPQTDSTSTEEEDNERSEVPSDYPNDYESDTETTTKTFFGGSGEFTIAWKIKSNAISIIINKHIRLPLCDSSLKVLKSIHC
jgi:hypothetical protein